MIVQIMVGEEGGGGWEEEDLDEEGDVGLAREVGDLEAGRPGERSTWNGFVTETCEWAAGAQSVPMATLQ